MSKFKRRVAAATALLAAMALTACGGGSSSTGSGNSGGESSTLVVNSSPGLALFHRPHHQLQGHTHLAAFIAGWLVQNAWAAPLAGSEVIVFNGDGNQIEPTTSDPEMLFYVVPPDFYTVCVYAVLPDDPSPGDIECNDPQAVGSDELVVVTAVPSNGATEFTVDVETREDNIALFQNPDRPNQTYVCHKGRVTKSVGTPAALGGHKAHGDSLGPCENFGEGQENTGGNNNGNNGNKGGRGNDNRCNKGKPKKGCEAETEQG